MSNPYIPEYTLYEELSDGKKEMVDSPNPDIRRTAAAWGYGPDKLVDDPEMAVQIELAERGWGLDKLVNHSDRQITYQVENALKREGLTLNEWIKKHPDKCALPENREVKQTFTLYADLTPWQQIAIEMGGLRGRFSAVEDGLGLDKLAFDEDSDVRILVAKQGFGLDKLVEDENALVQYAALRYLQNNKQTIEEWIEKNPDRCLLPENKQPNLTESQKHKRGFIPYAELGAEQKALVDSSNVEDRFTQAYRKEGLDKLIDDYDYVVRRVVAEQGYGLDTLVKDQNYWVRAEVAKQGYGLDRLIRDPNSTVVEGVLQHLDEHNQTLGEWIAANPDKCAALENQEPEKKVILYADLSDGEKQMVDSPDLGSRLYAAGRGYGLDKLIDDSSFQVRWFVANHNYGLDRLVTDQDPSVRQKVAKQGYGLDMLVKDDIYHVRNAAQNFLSDQGITVGRWVRENPEKCALAENKMPKKLNPNHTIANIGANARARAAAQNTQNTNQQQQKKQPSLKQVQEIVTKE